MTTELSNEQIFVKTAITAWEQWAARATKFFNSLSDEQMLQEIAPGKNRAIYLFGHLLVVDDAIIPQLRLGEARFESLRETFVKQPDGAVTDLPSIGELRQGWKDTHAELTELLSKLTPSEWLERHSAVSEEDFAKEPHRNRLAILLSRTSHLSYHVGQLLLLKK
ncbi:DinB family protein [Acidicapsa ligni]|uniref:DinB family protein n=1 Tax=Acidicapsa ligni TaxID=542300 RepID=UPI0021E09AD2|nr:DinB family protein [Acidicapsa ligni]